MRTTTLGVNGPTVGRIGLGTMGMSFGYDPQGRDDATSVSVIRQALDLGVTLIDTADVYGPYTNEELVGQALAGRREDAVLVTKGGLTMSEEGLGFNGRPDHLRAAIDASLKRLGTDYVDLYFLHRIDPEVPLEESWGALGEIADAGKVRAIGLSEVGLAEIQRAESVRRVDAVESEMSLFTRGSMTDVLPYLRDRGIAFLPYSPLGRGLLTGRFSAPSDLTDGDWRSGLPRFTEEAMRANQAQVDAVHEVARRHEATAGQVALAWLLEQGEHIVPIPGTKNPRYLAENAAAADLVLSTADLAALDALPAPVGARE
ncbi:aldo/keto reductase [Streptomyces sp. VRA16 Mangrove soil]|uniref:aldo/keto reductase n=1 Tax=Streptomyces sp. VRA16 Mangrove soil TaxID=2817434 RepID=UPI001A9D3BAD|nr:aldo/keto reductase [Streptomyces sp. VRA16 Mangrove soil]MBO1331387.1 aldo/keto reductase [Streptomyces sp. VRA16 Mangrove soil]